MKINIKQMAEKAGVSVATISRVINPETASQVAPATRKKIEALVKKFNYTPNLAGRNLRQTATKNIGLLLPYFKEAFYSFYYTHILSGVAEALALTDYRLKILLLRKDDRNWDNYDFRTGEQIDGLIVSFWGHIFSNPKAFKKIGLPCVIVDGWTKEARALYVSADHFHGGQLAAEYFYQKGHRQFAIINGPSWSVECQMRVDGFAAYLKLRGIKINEKLILNADFNPNQGYACAQEILNDQGPQVSAIFACTDHLALGAIRAIKDKGLQCPQDISVIGFDDDYWMNYLGLKLTTIRFPVFEIAKEAAHQLLQYLKAKKFTKPLTGKILTPVSLIERETVKPR